jgi:hypothetical protein
MPHGMHIYSCTCRHAPQHIHNTQHTYIPHQHIHNKQHTYIPQASDPFSCLMECASTCSCIGVELCRPFPPSTDTHAAGHVTTDSDSDRLVHRRSSDSKHAADSKSSPTRAQASEAMNEYAVSDRNTHVAHVDNISKGSPPHAKAPTRGQSNDAFAPRSSDSESSIANMKINTRRDNATAEADSMSPTAARNDRDTVRAGADSTYDDMKATARDGHQDSAIAEADSTSAAVRHGHDSAMAESESDAFMSMFAPPPRAGQQLRQREGTSRDKRVALGGSHKQPAYDDLEDENQDNVYADATLPPALAVDNSQDDPHTTAVSAHKKHVGGIHNAEEEEEEEEEEEGPQASVNNMKSGDANHANALGRPVDPMPHIDQMSHMGHKPHIAVVHNTESGRSPQEFFPRNAEQNSCRGGGEDARQRDVTVSSSHQGVDAGSEEVVDEFEAYLQEQKATETNADRLVPKVTSGIITADTQQPESLGDRNKVNNTTPKGMDGSSGYHHGHGDVSAGDSHHGGSSVGAEVGGGCGEDASAGKESDVTVVEQMVQDEGHFLSQAAKEAMEERERSRKRKEEREKLRSAGKERTTEVSTTAQDSPNLSPSAASHGNTCENAASHMGGDVESLEQQQRREAQTFQENSKTKQQAAAVRAQDFLRMRYPDQFSDRELGIGRSNQVNAASSNTNSNSGKKAESDTTSSGGGATARALRDESMAHEQVEQTGSNVAVGESESDGNLHHCADAQLIDGAMDQTRAHSLDQSVQLDHANETESRQTTAALLAKQDTRTHIVDTVHVVTTTGAESSNENQNQNNSSVAELQDRIAQLEMLVKAAYAPPASNTHGNICMHVSVCMYVCVCIQTYMCTYINTQR